MTHYILVLFVLFSAAEFVASAADPECDGRFDGEYQIEPCQSTYLFCHSGGTAITRVCPDGTVYDGGKRQCINPSDCIPGEVTIITPGPYNANNATTNETDTVSFEILSSTTFTTSTTPVTPEHVTNLVTDLNLTEASSSISVESSATTSTQRVPTTIGEAGATNKELTSRVEVTTISELPPIGPDLGVQSYYGERSGEACVSGPLDLIFIVDGSTSIFSGNFTQAVTLVRKVIERFDIGAQSVKVGLIQFNARQRTEFSLDDYLTKNDLLEALAKVQYEMGTTKAGAAIDYAIDVEFQPEKGDRANVPNRIIMITDGVPQDSVLNPIKRAVAEGIETFAVGVTDHSWYSVLMEIANYKADHVIKADDLRRDLDGSVDILLYGLTSGQCGQKPPVVSKTGSPITRPTPPPYESPATRKPVSVISGSAPSTKPGQFTPIDKVDIKCGGRSITINGQTGSKPFTGKVYSKGHYKDPECLENFVDNKDRQISVEFELGKCGVQQTRDDRGVYLTATIIFMAHQSLLTKFDRAYRVQCFYMEAEKTVTYDLGVSMINTENLDLSGMAMPVCKYTLHSDSLNGPEVRHAILGKTVVHKWTCEPQQGSDAEFGMKVHSCFARDGDDGSNDALLIDENGCSVDRTVMPDLTYNGNLDIAYVQTNVFKFADVQNIKFDCKIQACLKGQCDGITPPSCAKMRRSKRETFTDLLTDLIVHSPDLMVFEKTLLTPYPAPQGLTSIEETRKGRYCMKPVILGICVTFYLLILCFGISLPFIRACLSSGSKSSLDSSVY